jgi:hypothetical protein
LTPGSQNGLYPDADGEATVGLLCRNVIITLARDSVLGRDAHAEWVASLPGEA